ncbi:2-dehydropantoate 2-reductase [Hypoxylon sp. NC1633]|nr:2-dehydropantoate 2-reductase [Hypoxylon sp. NC1633]
MTDKKNILLVGSGGVGTMAAFSLEAGGGASVTAVLRSNYAAVEENGFDIKSIDYGIHKGWKPTKVVDTVPDVARDGLAPFDFIVVATKNCPDVGPTVPEIIAPAVTEGRTVVVLVQNGLNIEKPLISAFPNNIAVSGVSLIGAAEKGHGNIAHDDHDVLIVGPFHNPNVPTEAAAAAAKLFVDIYGASGKVRCEFNEDVGFVRWRKLLYNACYNPIAAVARMDTSRLRLAKTPIDDIVRPAMREIWNAAKAAGHELPDDQVEKMIEVDPLDVWCQPSMLQDVEKGNFTEYVNLVEEPVKEAERLGIPTPTLKIILGFCRALQWKAMEAKDLVTIPVGARPSHHA